MHTFALTSLALALSAFASPTHPTPRSNACPENSVLNMSNFTLLALDIANATVARALTLSAFDNTTVLSTVNTAPSVAAEFTMKNGALVSATASSLFIPAQGGLLEFGTTDFPAMAYCNVYSTSPHGAQYPYTLGVNGNTTSLSICTSTSSVDVAVFKPTESAVYDLSSCTAVIVHIIQ